MKRLSIYLSIIVSLALFINFTLTIHKIDSVSKKSNYRFDVPKVKKIVLSLPKKDHLENAIVWNVNTIVNSATGKPSMGIKAKGSKSAASVSFKLRNIDGIPVLYNVLNNGYRWEFFGIAKTENGYKAIVFNPSLKDNRLRIVGCCEKLDEFLTLDNISQDNITVVFSGGKVSKKFFITVFNVPKEKEGIYR